jgi:hypothetical protein
VEIRKYIFLGLFFVVPCHGITFENDYSIRMPSPSFVAGLVGASAFAGLGAFFYWWQRDGVYDAAMVKEAEVAGDAFKKKSLVGLNCAAKTAFDAVLGGVICSYLPIIGSLLDYRTYRSIQKNACECFMSRLVSVSSKEFSAFVKEGLTKEAVLKEIDELSGNLEDFALAMRSLLAAAKGKGGDWYELFHIKGKGLLDAIALTLGDLENKRAILQNMKDR